MFNPELYVKAIQFAGHAHLKQEIPGENLPYLSHLAEVAMETILVAEKYPNLDANLMITIALLHDTLEDTEVRYETIVENFGEQVAKAVSALTKNFSLPTKREQMADSLDRILALNSVEVRIIKMADRINNLQPPPAHWTTEKCLAYQEEARYILERLGGVNDYIEKRLAQKIAAYQIP